MPNKSSLERVAQSAHQSTAKRFAIDDLTALRAFSEVVASGSFVAAARRIGVAPSTISKHISALEKSLSTLLINRTTRSLALTEAGVQFVEHCHHILNAVDAAEDAVFNLNDQPKGHLKITAPTVLATRYISPRLSEFAHKYPQISLELILTSRRVDLLREGVDLAIRVMDPEDSDLVVTKLATNRRVFCASPEYLDLYGVPKSPADLENHNCLVSSGITANDRWPIMKNGELTHVAVNGSFIANNGEAVMDLALAGVGVAMLPTFLVHEMLRDGRLVEVLADSAADNTSIYAVFPERRYLPPKTREFLNFLRAIFLPKPPWGD